MFRMSKFNMDQVKGIGKIGLKIGKTIVIDGTKSVMVKGAVVAITVGFEEGFNNVKNIKLDEILKGKRDEIKDKVFAKKDEVLKDNEDLSGVKDVTGESEEA